MRSLVSSKLAAFRLDYTQSFGIDPRSLALFRVAIALVLLSDLWLRIINIGAFYTDSGILPRAAQIEIFSGLPALLSVHMMNGTATGELLLFAVSIGAALALLVGYRTWMATFVSWVLLVSIHNRNPMVLQGGDVLLRVMLFWGLFLPLNARASLDRWLAPPATEVSATEVSANPAEMAAISGEKYPNIPFLSVATFAALLQVCFVYWFTWALKTDASWRVDGTAVGYALSIDQLSTPYGRMLLRYPDVMRMLTFVTLGLERFGPLVALVPFWRLRLLMVLVFVGFHFTMGLCMTLGVFTWIAPTSWLLFVPTGAWDWAALQFGKLNAGAVRDRGIARLSEARARVVKFCRGLGMRAPAPRPLALSRAVTRQSLAAFFLIYIFAWNIRSVDFNRYSPYFGDRWNWIGESLRLDQVWSMFSPLPLKEDGWFVAPATLNDGTQVNLIDNGAPMKWTEPENLSNTFRDAQWQKYMLNLWSADNAPHRGYYVGYIVRQWNADHAPKQQVKAMQLIYMQQTNLEGFRKDKVKKVVLWNAKF